MLISSVNENPHKNYPVWRLKDEKNFLVKMLMEEKVLLKEVWE
jgi:hypothetical protein